MRDIFGDDKSSVEQLKTRWGDVMSNWTTKDNLTEDQIIVFKELYLKQQAMGITKAMQNHASNTVTELDMSNYGVNNSEIQDGAIDEIANG